MVLGVYVLVLFQGATAVGAASSVLLQDYNCSAGHKPNR